MMQFCYFKMWYVSPSIRGVICGLVLGYIVFAAVGLS